jgi:hypothetical protein
VSAICSCQNLISVEIDPKFASAVGKLGKSEISFKATAFKSELLRYVRVVSFVGQGYDVFNFLAIPREGVIIPILGIDFVCLPGE